VSVEDYAELRAQVSAVDACLALALAAEGEILPAGAAAAARQTNLCVSYVNDLFSWPKEQPLGERSNLVAVLRETAGLDPGDAFTEACRISDATVAAYLAAAPTGRRLCGMRHVVHDEEDDGFCVRPDFMRGVAVLAEFGLAYDLLLFPRHLAPALVLARATPGVTFVLDHIANPHVAATAAKARAAAAPAALEPEAWERDLRALAALPNVFVKASGLVTLAEWGAFADEDFFPCLDVVFDAFGRARVMVGSDWPVCTLAAEYADVIGIVRDFLAPLAAAEREAIEGGNAARFYALDVG
jgi:predicted TIM-barrel fold metal-dependent hydrolase